MFSLFVVFFFFDFFGCCCCQFSYLRAGDWEKDVVERLAGSWVGDGNVGPRAPAYAQLPRLRWDLAAFAFAGLPAPCGKRG